MGGGFVSQPRNCAAASSLDYNFAQLGYMSARLRTYKIVLLEEFCAAGIIILKNCAAATAADS